MNKKTRNAVFDDYPKIASYDEFLGDRRIDMQKGEIFVCDTNDECCVGYTRISTEYFFDWPLIVNLCVNEEHRNQGVGTELVQYVTRDDRWPRLYVSTEEGNEPMLALLAKVSAHEIGFIDKLNFSNEREMIFRLK